MFTSLYSFRGIGSGNGDGATPHSGVTVGSNGVLYLTSGLALHEGYRPTNPNTGPGSNTQAMDNPSRR